jgi:hypothetical protein
MINIWNVIRFLEIGPFRFGDPLILFKILIGNEFRIINIDVPEGVLIVSDRIGDFEFSFSGPDVNLARLFQIIIYPGIADKEGDKTPDILVLDRKGLQYQMSYRSFLKIKPKLLFTKRVIRAFDKFDQLHLLVGGYAIFVFERRNKKAPYQLVMISINPTEQILL